MYKIAVLGDRDSIYGFAALGLDIYPVAKGAEAASELHHLAENGYAVIYVTESVADSIAQDIAQYADRPFPAVIPIPGVSGNTGSGMANVKKFVEQAVGSDIIFNGES
jgi:V/A-type H+-transporting ATPase subunit F